MAWLTVMSTAISAMSVLGQARATTSTVVSLTFDNGTISQYVLGYQQALQTHNVPATFFVNSGTITTTQGANFMTWSKLADLAAAGNDIGGKSVNSTNLTTDSDPTTQVCQDRQNLIQHGFDPIAFAYPAGATNATVKAIVKNCGYGNARIASQLSPSGPVWAETLPPADWFATRAYAPSAVTLTNLESLVNGAAAHNGGWVQVVIGRVCSQALDPANYSTCSTASGHIELSDLNAFLDWVQSAGQSGGAPDGTSFDTVAHVVTGADAVAPTTTISCNGAPCSASPYDGSVTVTLSATDVGSGVRSTHYTTDGSDPTLSSPTYTGPFGVNGTGTSTTVKFRSWDRAGNAEAVQTQVIQAPPDTTAPTTTISCNGSPCAGPYVDSVSVSLAATDTGGSGVDATYYTTDGSTPTISSTVYAAPFQLTQSSTVQFFSTDKAGNAESVQSQQIQVVPHATIVSLTFDNGTVGQYNLAYQQALKPHGAHATFFVNSGNVGASAQIMTWDQLTALAADGNDIGGKTVSSTNLTTDPDPATQVCQDRQNLISHGLDPIAFAYPGGAFNATVKGIVQACGYGNARSAGSLSPNGPTYAETLPPKDWLATRAYPGTGTPSAVTLDAMETLTTNAAANGGGWVQIVMTRVCSQGLDPDNYSTCLQASGHVELADLVSFLDWVQNAGGSGDAPAGTVIQTVRDTISAADTVAPTTAISCDVGPCSGSYDSVVKVTLSATDLGTGISSTHYTTDGSTPTTGSPAYTRPIAISSPTTLKFRSWDNVGNAEAVQTQQIQATPPPDTTPPVTTISCDDAPCTTDGYQGLVTVKLTADDGSGWGVDETFYTTDGSTPTQSSQVYSGPFQLSTGTYTVKFFSVDFAGNIESVNSQDMKVLPAKTVVTITFDDGDASQYSLAFTRGLEPHGMHGTFFINTGNIENGPGFMTWSNLSSLAQGGQEVGGHTVHHIDLTSSSYTQQQKIDEVCNDRQALIDHGLSPVSFAYPFGAYDANAETIVHDCGYTSARRTGGLPASPPPYAEAIPPADPYATRTWTAPTATDQPIRLSDMEAAVTGAATHGGGWLQIVVHEVCSQTYDPDNYSSCLGSFRPMELDTLNAFLDWLQNAGQGGAPGGTVVHTVTQVINGPDTQAPTTTITCDGSACQSSDYGGSVTVRLSATDQGGAGVDKTYYTTDGSTPTTSSTVYDGPFLLTASATVQFFSTDLAGNAEQPNSQQIKVAPNADPVIASAGDIACDPTSPAFNDGAGTATDCRAVHTAGLMTGVDAVLPLGDDQYDCGGSAAFAQSYDKSWGRFKPITHPVPGDADYKTSGGTDCPTVPGAGYYAYFGSSAGDPAKGYYSYDLGAWHIVALNTAQCPNDPSVCGKGSAQEQWLKADLAASSASCTLAYFQNPRFASTPSGGSSTYGPFWNDLYAAGADVVLNGDAHWYERFQPLDPSGAVDTSKGIREFIVGTGGAGLDTPSTQLSTSAVLDHTTHGVLKITLTANGYQWVFVPDEGTFTDSGSADCHTAPDTIAPTTTIACNDATCQGSPYSGLVSVTLSATDNASGSGVDKTYYTTDGSTPTTSSTVYTGAFQVSQTSTVQFFSTDLAGNKEDPKSQQIQIATSDTIPPTTTIACNGGGCDRWFSKSPVKISLSATDAGGSGVDKTYYTTDGSTPTTSSTVYTGSFSITKTATVKFFSTDKAGNAESVQSQLVTIDTTAPTTSISCSGGSCSGWFKATPVTVTLSAMDAGGSGVDKTYYTTDGSTPTTSSTVYTGSFAIPQTTTVKFFSVDKAGNVESVESTTIQVDAAAPTVSITSPADGSSFKKGSKVSISASATDLGTGTGAASGIASVVFYLDGTTVLATDTRSPFTATWNTSKAIVGTHTITAVATDRAGNSTTSATITVTIT